MSFKAKAAGKHQTLTNTVETLLVAEWMDDKLQSQQLQGGKQAFTFQQGLTFQLYLTSSF